MAIDPDLPLDDLAVALAPAVMDGAPFDGLGDDGIRAAAMAEGIDPDVAVLAYPGGAMDVIAAWSRHTDRTMAEALPAELLAALPVSERIRRLVAFRIAAMDGKHEALRRARSIMAMPQNVTRTAELAWSVADRMWRLAGDTATDYNHYTKRATLAAVYAATLTTCAEDDSSGQVETLAFLDRRIDDIMRFEKAKARVLRPRDETFSLSRFLGRLRYPAT